LKGRVRVYEFSSSNQEYQELWSYKIPPDYYSAWVSAVDVSADGSVVVLGSYEPSETDTSGHLYVFDVAVGSSYIFKSDDYAGTVDAVSVSADGGISVGASYGPYQSPNGWDLIAYSKNTDQSVYQMEGTYPGSLFTCGINEDGSRIVAGGKRVHAYEMGSGGWAYSIEIVDDGPTATPAQTATPTPTPTPTCPATGVTCQLNDDIYFPGDTFLLSLTACNGDPTQAITFPVFLVLDVFGTYYFSPGWTEDLSSHQWSIPPCSCVENIILEFEWPETGSEADGIIFYCAMLNDEMTELIGELGMCVFGWR